MSDTTTQTLAAPSAWNKPLATIEVHGKQPKTSIFRMKHMIWVVIGIVAYNIFVTTVDDFAKKLDADEIRPQMEQLANSGVPDATMWMVKHYPEEYRAKLPSLAAAGQAEALYYQGLKQVMARDSADKDTGVQFIKLAAEKGYEPAVKWVKKYGNGQ